MEESGSDRLLILLASYLVLCARVESISGSNISTLYFAGLVA